MQREAAMRVVCLANNWTGWQVVAGLRRRGVELAGLVLHDEARRTYGEQILAAADLPPERVLDGSRLGDPGVLADLRAMNADLAISVFFAHIIKEPVLSLFPKGIVNLHPGYLPFNRGVYANVWAIVEGTPAGATLHYVDAGVDTGDIIARQRVEVRPDDTGETLYRRLERACVGLFFDAWPTLAEGRAPRTPQDPAAGSVHTHADVAALDRIDPAGQCRAGRLIDIIRARTFPPYKGAYVEVEGKRYYLGIGISEEE